jgi:hypothetical protein
MSTVSSVTDINDLRATIDEAKGILPMPALMRKMGLDAFIDVHANCQCPFCWRNDAFALRENGDGTWRFDCCDCGSGDEVSLFQKHLDITFIEAARRYVELAGVGDDVSGLKPPSEVMNSEAEPTRLEKLLNEIRRFLCRYIVFQCPEQHTVIALWIFHTWTINISDYTPYLFVHSAEKRSGKTRLLDVLDLLVNTPWRAAGASEAVLFRKVDRDKPTLLYDEIDTVFGSNRNNGMENIRRFFNVGFERGTKIPRCVGEGAKQDIQEFDPFCAKALSGIGKVLPDTVTDRCLPIELQRQSREEKAERFRKREAETLACHIRAELEGLCQQSGLIEMLRAAQPALPEELSDRQQDICEPLLAIADIAEGDWPQIARAAVTKLCTQEEDASNGVKLLSDIKAVFDSTVADRLPTEQILEELVEIEDSPWAIWWQDDLKNQKVAKVAAKLARMLKAYKRSDGERLKPRTIRIGDETPKGFHRSDFEQAWSRYLPPPCETAATSATTATHNTTDVAAVADVAPPW